MNVELLGQDVGVPGIDQVHYLKTREVFTSVSVRGGLASHCLFLHMSEGSVLNDPCC